MYGYFTWCLDSFSTTMYYAFKYCLTRGLTGKQENILMTSYFDTKTSLNPCLDSSFFFFFLMSSCLRCNPKLLPYCHLRVRGWIHVSLDCFFPLSSPEEWLLCKNVFPLPSFILVTVLFLFSLQISPCLLCSGSFHHHQMDAKRTEKDNCCLIVFSELSRWVSSTFD